MWKKIKDIKISTKLIMFFSAMMLLLLISFFLGYTSADQIRMKANPEEYLSKIATVTAVEFFLAVFFGGGIAAVVIRRIKRSLATIKAGTDELVKGKVDVVLDNDANDEFGMIMQDFQTVVENIKEQAEVAQQVADGNFAIEVKPKSEEDVMGQALKKMVESNRYAMGNIRDAAQQVTTGAQQVAGASEALAEGSTEQASAIEQITASISEMAEGTKQNAAQANAAADLMKQTIANVKKGNVEMNEMVSAMSDINQSSESISKIIKVIDDIAFQTNILALNAAVEAARAGDAGKGFAVVADEVRNLAAKSAAAAAETAELIEDSIKKVEIGSRIANGTAEALQEITDVVKQSEALITEIAEASNYQATAITQINQAVEQVSQVVQTNSATSQQCSAASEELLEQAARVREMIAAYKLEK
ncbi:MAG: methyl-accepting chemotaxis protein [Lachnospiraceae bacterium]|nr:methyl-accepting chemotaxis protein [Lachnospiraceae bacterium]